MAQAVEQYTPRDEDRWTLDRAFDYLTETLGYPEAHALREMEQQRLTGRLVVQVHKIVDGKPQGDPEYLPPDKKHKLIRHLGRVIPQNHKWGDNRWTVYKQRVLELWPRPPAFPSAPDQQPEAKVAAEAAERPSAGQFSQNKSKTERQTQITRVKQVLKELWPPDGHPPADMTLKAILKLVHGKFPKDLKLPGRDTLARALGRRRV